MIENGSSLFLTLKISEAIVQFDAPWSENRDDVRHVHKHRYRHTYSHATFWRAGVARTSTYKFLDPLA